MGTKGKGINGHYKRVKMRSSIALIAILCGIIITIGCGYVPSSSTEIKTIAIPVFGNRTLWRGYEFELTNLVQNEILVRLPDYRLVSDPTKADRVLMGEIVNMSKPVLVEGELGRTIQSQVSITLRVLIKDQHTGKIIYDGEHSEVGELVGQRFENEESARRKVYEKSARWISTLLETNQ